MSSLRGRIDFDPAVCSTEQRMTARNCTERSWAQLGKAVATTLLEALEGAVKPH